MSQFTTLEQKASYGIGRNVGDQLARQSFSGLDISAVQQGLADAINGVEFAVSPADLDAAFKQITEKMEAEQAQKSSQVLQEGVDFLAKNQQRSEVTVTESGLQYEVLQTGNGKRPSATDKVQVHYHGTLVNGEVFDSSVARGQPAEFPVNGMIAGWVEALQLMMVGDKWKLYIPHELAYGSRGAGSIPPNATLIFEVELLAIL